MGTTPFFLIIFFYYNFEFNYLFEGSWCVQRLLRSHLLSSLISSEIYQDSKRINYDSSQEFILLEKHRNPSLRNINKYYYTSNVDRVER